MRSFLSKSKAHVQEHEAWRTPNTCYKQHNTSCYAIKSCSFFVPKIVKLNRNSPNPRHMCKNMKPGEPLTLVTSSITHLVLP